MKFPILNYHSGFSLIEVMVSLIITMVIFIGLFNAFPTSLSINNTAKNASQAAYIAQDELENLFSLDYNNINTGTIETKHRLSSDPSNNLYYFQRQTVVSYVDGNLQSSATDQGLKKISTTVYYSNVNFKKEGGYNITTLISQW